MNKPIRMLERIGKRNRSAKMYNKAISDYEKFLPSEEEIAKIIIDMDVEKRKKHPQEDATFLEIAKAISKRIKEK